MDAGRHLKSVATHLLMPSSLYQGNQAQSDTSGISAACLILVSTKENCSAQNWRREDQFTEPDD